MKKNITATEAQSRRSVEFLVLGINGNNFWSMIKYAINELIVSMSPRLFPKFHPLSPQPPSDVGNLNILRPPTENFGGDKLIHRYSIHPAHCAQRLRMVNFFTLFLLFNVSIFSQANEYSKEEKKEKTNIEIMQENEANVEKDRASREKEPLTGYDAETNSKKSIKENNEKNSNFWVVGGSIGSPAGGNINVGYYFTNFVLRASGMRYSQHWSGIQGDIGYAFWKTSVIAHSVSLVLGDMRMRPFDPLTQQGGQNKYERDGIPGYTNQPPTLTDTLIRSYIAEQNPDLATALEYQYRTRQYANFRQQYVGLTYDLLLGNFFLQVGMGYGRGDYRNPQLLLQMGYLFDFGRKAE